MKTFGELTPRNLSAVVEIPRAAVHIAWTDDFYDGPLSGIAKWKGRRYRFEMTDRSRLGGDGDELAEIAIGDRGEGAWCKSLW